MRAKLGSAPVHLSDAHRMYMSVAMWCVTCIDIGCLIDRHENQKSEARLYDEIICFFNCVPG